MKASEIVAGDLYRATNGKVVKVIKVTSNAPNGSETEKRKLEKVTSICTMNPRRPKCVGEERVQSMDAFCIWAHERLS